MPDESVTPSGRYPETGIDSVRELPDVFNATTAPTVFVPRP